MQCLAIRVFAAGRVQLHGLARSHVHLDRTGTRLAVHHQLRIVVGMGEVFDRPLHAGGKVVLVGLAPAPDGGLVGDVHQSIMSDNAILRSGAGKQIATLCPDGVRLAVGLPVDIAASPAAPVRPAPGAQAVVDQPQVRRRIPFHDEQEAGIYFAQRTLGADILVQPLIGYQAGIGPGAVAVIKVAANAGPGGVHVLFSVWVAGFDDVDQRRKLAANPGTCVVLVGDGGDT